ncbi:hypothetical protein [Mycoplasmopsis felis]|uniref:Uncharacterized protein n=1 Tax=Mycoplasmopsis felis TaxID=33923 RepID=A0A809RRV8_9BACT|nr:hypothetical protein [Mycoplasmopsis felis]BBU47675.1 hypothetical protein JPM2_3680 [Mycoplasmopsis felis]
MINEYQSYYETNNSINNADPNYQTHRDEFERRIVTLDTYQKTVEFEQYYDSIRYTDEYVLDPNYGVRLDNVNNSNNVRVSVLFNTVQNKPIVLTYLISEVENPSNYFVRSNGAHNYRNRTATFINRPDLTQLISGRRYQVTRLYVKTNDNSFSKEIKLVNKFPFVKN